MCWICQAKSLLRNHYAYRLRSANPPNRMPMPKRRILRRLFLPSFMCHTLVFHSMLQSACCHNRTFDRIDFSSLPACALRYSLKLRRTEMTAEHARWWAENRPRKEHRTCLPPLPDPASTPPIAKTRMGNLMIMNTTLQAYEMRNATRCSNTDSSRWTLDERIVKETSRCRIEQCKLKGG